MRDYGMRGAKQEPFDAGHSNPNGGKEGFKAIRVTRGQTYVPNADGDKLIDVADLIGDEKDNRLAASGIEGLERTRTAADGNNYGCALLWLASKRSEWVRAEAEWKTASAMKGKPGADDAAANIEILKKLRLAE